MFQSDLATVWEKQRESGDLDQSDHLSSLINIQINFDHAAASTLLIKKEADRTCKGIWRLSITRLGSGTDLTWLRPGECLYSGQFRSPYPWSLCQSHQWLYHDPRRGNDSVLRRIELTIDATFREICRPREGRSLRVWRLSGARNARWNGIGELQSTLSVGDDGAVSVHRRTHNGQQSRLEYRVTAGIRAEL